MLKPLLLVGLGGGIGSMLRYLTSAFANKYFPSIFPWGTFVVNVLGCLLIGILLGIFERQALANPNLKFLFITGFCGGYTTFSTFAAENLELYQSGNILTLVFYITTSVLIGVLAVWLGMEIIR